MQTKTTNYATTPCVMEISSFRTSQKDAVEAQRWTRLAGAVLRQAIDDAAQGHPIDIEDLRAWAVLAGLPWFYVEGAINAASSSPATAA